MFLVFRQFIIYKINKLIIKKQKKIPKILNGFLESLNDCLNLTKPYNQLHL